MGAGQRRGRAFFQEVSPESRTSSLRRLLLASFLTLFAELAFIRWIAVEIRVFAYFKNLALLLCFVGFGLGCSLAGKPVRWRRAITALLGLLVIVRLPWHNGVALEQLSEGLGAAADVEIWKTGLGWNWTHFLAAAALAALIFLLLVWIFIPLGQVVSCEMDRTRRPLVAYSWNVAASLAGILAFLAVSRMMLSPVVWLGVVLAGFALLQGTRRDRMLAFSLLVPLALVLHNPSKPDHFSMWTPYQQIDYTQTHLPDGSLYQGLMTVNHTGYQITVNLSPEFIASHPSLLKEPADENPYNVPFRFAVPSPRVMIVGSGTGNDVAAALRHNSVRVDAVEIDPAILDLGRRLHPEHPYESPRVTAHLTDARAFLKRSSQKYDLVLFGLLDSHTQLSDYSNMRIDNFVYTKESFREAKAHLAPDGVLFVKFEVDRPWMGARIVRMLQETFGKPPIAFFARSSYSSTASCFAISPSGRIEQALTSDAQLNSFVQANRQVFDTSHIPPTTDNWPYLYQEGRWIPRTYESTAVLVMIVAFALYFQIPEARRHPPSAFFFFMGAGFLLLETQVISRLALYFGTTWQVNGIVIAAMLVAILLANALVEKIGNLFPKAAVLIALLAGLGLAYWIPPTILPATPSLAGTMLAGIFSVPVFLAGILFALEFRKVSSAGAALGANVLGAVVGGLLENFSLLWGMRALVLIAIILYCLAGLGLAFRATRATPALDRVPLKS